MRRSLIPALTVACLLSAGCQLMPAKWGARDDQDARSQATAPPAVESVLYARDGTIVSPGGSQSGSNLPRRDVQGGEGTRTKLLELYERVVEERDQLRLTASAQASELAQLRQALDKESARATDLESRLHSTEQARADLTQQNLDLAGRLTTAQIRRLESEKKWLELSISLPTKIVAASENPTPGPAIRPAVHAVKGGGSQEQQR